MTNSTELKAIALAEAIRAHGGTGVPAETIVKYAMEYEAFLSGKTKTVTQQKPKKKPR